MISFVIARSGATWRSRNRKLGLRLLDCHASLAMTFGGMTR